MLALEYFLGKKSDGEISCNAFLDMRWFVYFSIPCGFLENASGEYEFLKIDSKMARRKVQARPQQASP
jgi:hypothetical protein